jgi:hypothetical protein
VSARPNLEALDDIYEVKMLLLAKAKSRQETISGTQLLTITGNETIAGDKHVCETITSNEKACDDRRQ